MGTELGRALQAGCLRGADLWHVATALYVAPRAEEMGFVTLDGPQREVAAVLGLRSGPAGRLSIPDRATSQARGRPARSFVKCAHRSYSLSGAAGIKAGSPGTPGAPQS